MSQINSIRKRGSRFIHSENFVGGLFLAPLLLNFLIFVAFPILFSFILCFFKWDFMDGLNFSAMEFNGVENFRKLFRDEWFTASFKNTLIFAVGTVPVSIAIGLVLAAIIDKHVYCSNFFKISLFIPYIASIVASAIVWSVMLHPSYGPITEILRSIGIENPPKWFADMKWALPSVIMFSIWQQLGYVVLVYMAGLKGIPAELYESADIDGAGSIKKFFVITVPMVSPTTFFLFIIQLIGSFKVFDAISVLTEGGPGTSTTVIAYYIYRSAFRYYEMNKASAAAWIMFIIIFAITIYQWKQQKKWDNN